MRNAAFLFHILFQQSNRQAQHCFRWYTSVFLRPYKNKTRKYNAHLWGHIILRILLKLFRIT
jgi:hypothetical protein